LPAQLQATELLELAASELGVSIEYDPQEVRGTIALRVRRSLTPAELWTLLGATLESRGLSVVETGLEGVVRVRPTAEAQGDLVPAFAETGGEADD
jgi:hypothetical protein